jgi:carboxymethylenebutenolidase
LPELIANTTSYPSASDGLPVSTYLARPVGDGPFPAILMCYEFWGMLEVPGGGPHMRDVAQRFAQQGFVAAVPDYYAVRGQQPTMEGGVISGGPSDEEAVADLCEGVRWLQNQTFVRQGPVGAIGWCGGGRQTLFLAARCSGVGAAATFYGPPINRATRTGPSPIDVVPDIHCPVFGAFGEQDHAIPLEAAKKLEAELARCNVAHDMRYYPAGHAFMNDQRDSYDQPSATDAWQAVLDFFRRALRV